MLRSVTLALTAVILGGFFFAPAVRSQGLGNIQLAIYTTAGASAFSDEKSIRRSAVQYRVPCITTMSGARAGADAVAARLRDPIRVWSLQEIHENKTTLAS